MRRSKLEVYIGILETLAIKGQLKPTQIIQKANVNFKSLKDCLLFLIKQGLIEEKSFGGERVEYMIAPRGVRILQYFRVISDTFIQEPKRSKDAFEIEYQNANDIQESYHQGDRRGFLKPI